MLKDHSPITTTLLTPDTRILSLDELKSAFSNGQDRTEKYKDRLEGKVFFSLDSESSPYVDSLDVVFVDPEITPKIRMIQEDRLFNGGYQDYSGALREMHPSFENGRYLVGHLEGDVTEDPTFVVGGPILDAVLILLPQESIPEPEVQQNLARDTTAYYFTPDSQLACIVDLGRVFTREGVAMHTFSFVEWQNEQQNKLLRNIADQFSQRFEFNCLNNGVKYDDAWMVGSHGDELPPDTVEEVPATSSWGGYVRRVWLHPEEYLCCVCWTSISGEVYLACRCRSYELNGESGNMISANGLVRRRMEVIRRQVVRKLRENWLLFNDDLDGFVEPQWESCSYYEGVKMSLF